MSASADEIFGSHNAGHVAKSYSTEFDSLHKPGSVTPHSAIYRHHDLHNLALLPFAPGAATGQVPWKHNSPALAGGPYSCPPRRATGSRAGLSPSTGPAVFAELGGELINAPLKGCSEITRRPDMSRTS